MSYPRRRFVTWYLRHGDGRATESREGRIVLVQIGADVPFVDEKRLGPHLECEANRLGFDQNQIVQRRGI